MPNQLKKLYNFPNEKAMQEFITTLGKAYTNPSALSGGGCTIWLMGDLGAGKTTLAQALLRSVGYQGAVRSPTYAFFESYSVTSADEMNQLASRTFDVYHFDLYRFVHPHEWLELGFMEYLSTDTLRLIEWPQRAKKYLPDPELSIQITYSNFGRELRAIPYSRKGANLFIKSY